MTEIWKDIKGKYQVSNYGRVKSLNFNKTGKPQILKQQKHGKYLYINSLKQFVHRLVAEAFIPNPNNYPCINHKDENPLNNHADNLEWCTYKYNANYGTRINRISQGNKKCVLQYTKNMKLVNEYNSLIEAEQVTGINRKNISNCCLKRYGFKTAGGYIWKYKEVA